MRIILTTIAKIIFTYKRDNMSSLYCKRIVVNHLNVNNYQTNCNTNHTLKKKRPKGIKTCNNITQQNTKQFVHDRGHNHYLIN